MIYCYSFFIFSLFVLQNVSAQTCNPTTDCSMFGNLGAMVADPKNCEKYYVCISNGATFIPTATSFTCPSGQYFQALPRSCASESYPAFCNENYCGEFLASTLNICPSECPSIVPGLFADSSDCSSYFLCLGGGLTLQSNCPIDTPYFNGTTCVNDPSQCCSFNTPVCTKPLLQIPDPNDCTAYYLCSISVSDPEIPSESYRHNCPTGQYYDAPTYQCVPGTCSITPTATTTTPSTTPATTTLPPTEASTTLSTTTTTISSTPTTPSTTSITTTPSSTPTTTIPSTTITTTSTTTPLINICIDSANFNCPGDGYFAKCNYCAKSYFYCVGGVAKVGSCTGISVFNPVPTYPLCIQPGICPYDPSASEPTSSSTTTRTTSTTSTTAPSTTASTTTISTTDTTTTPSTTYTSTPSTATTTTSTATTPSTTSTESSASTTDTTTTPSTTSSTTTPSITSITTTPSTTSTTTTPSTTSTTTAPSITSTTTTTLPTTSTTTTPSTISTTTSPSTTSTTTSPSTTSTTTTPTTTTTTTPTTTTTTTPSTTSTTTSPSTTSTTTTPTATTTTTTTTTSPTTTTTTTPSTTSTTTSPSTTSTTTMPTTTTTTTPTTTTTTSPTTTTTTPSATTTPIKQCEDAANFNCPKDGYFVQCNYCAKSYFQCVEGVTTVQNCTGSLVFNPVPTYSICIAPGSCPYYPPTSESTSSTTSTATTTSATTTPLTTTIITSPSTTSTTTSPSTVSTTSSPTTTSTTTTATTTAPIKTCIDPANFNCPNDGYFAQCNYCVSSYLNCYGGVASVGNCGGSLVFNPVPTYSICIAPGSCPYYPSRKTNV